MEALLAISGLLAAAGLGAVGVGYARTRGSARGSSTNFPGVTAINTPDGTIYTGPGGSSTSPSIAAFGPGSAPTATGLLPNGLPSGSTPGTLANGVAGRSSANGISAPGKSPPLTDPFSGPKIYGEPGSGTEGVLAAALSRGAA